jgi:probable 2-oxoglutarate dehydrogenase E1 component DHKTD1
MNDSEMFDQFLAKKFAQVKRYGLEGNEAMMPLLDALFNASARHGSTHVVVGMPHRGRLNFLTGLLKYPLPALFYKMKGASEIPAGIRGTGDVLSHLGKLTPTLVCVPAVLC